MTPDFGTRLDNCIKALQQVVLPAIDPADALACEQAALVLGHLTVLRSQIDHLADYEQLCLDAMLALGSDLSRAASGGPATVAARQKLDGAIGAATAPANARASSARARRNAVAAAVDDVIDASAVDGDASFLAGSQRLVIDHGLRQSARDRAWFAVSGLDPDSASLPSIAELVGTT